MAEAFGLRRIAANTLILWTRILATMAATVLATRFALQALGVDAFGVFIAAASLPLMFGFVTGAMTVTTQRMLTTGLANAPMADRQGVFSACLGPHLVVGGIIILTGETLGVWLLNNLLSVPEALSDQAHFVLRFIVGAAAIGAALAPYEALLQVHERFGLFAALDVLRASILVLGGFWLLDYSGDRLVAYAVIQGCTSIGINLIGAIITVRQCPEARMRLRMLYAHPGHSLQWNLFSWTTLGAASAIMRNQGFVVLANVFFGPAGSAAFAVCNQLNGALRQLSNAMSQAIAPQVYKIEAAGDRDKMVAVAFFTSKYAFLVGAIIGAPLIIGSDEVLMLWLGSPPVGAATSLKFLTGSFLVDQLSVAVGVAHLAVGRIAGYQVICGLVSLAAVPIGYVVGVQGGDFPMMLMGFAFTSAVVAFLRIILLEPAAPGAVWSWVRVTVLPSVPAFAAGLVAALVVAQMLPPGFERVVAVSFANLLAILATVALIGLDARERQLLKGLVLRWAPAQ